jgi:hypothetical protein
MFLLPPDSPLTKGQVSRRTLLTDSSHTGPQPSGTPLARGDSPRVVRLKGALIEIRLEWAPILIVAQTQGFPYGSPQPSWGTVPGFRTSRTGSGGETWGPVSPENIHESGASPGGQSGSPIVAAEAQQVERTRRKTWSRLPIRGFCALQAPFEQMLPRAISRVLDGWAVSVEPGKEGARRRVPNEVALRLLRNLGGIG